MSDKELIHAWGKWFALLHQASKEFESKQRELCKSIQSWDQIHECVMKNAPVHADDLAVIDDPLHYGVIHGDFNTTNFHFIDDENQLSVFDWDQAHRGWYLWDLAQPIYAITCTADCGNPFEGGKKIEGCDPIRFTNLLVEGYESVMGEGAVNKDRLSRMVELRMYYMETFCRVAKS